MSDKPEATINVGKDEVVNKELVTETNLNNVESSDFEGSINNKNKKRKKMNIFLYWLLSAGSFGLWNRFRPRKGGWKGSWFVTTVMLAILSVSLITERFYKSEFNELARAQLELEVDVLPAVLPFEQGKIIAKDDAKLEIDTLKHQVSALESEKVALEAALERSNNAFSNKQSESEVLTANFEGKLKERDDKIAALKMQLSAESSVSEIAIGLVESKEPGFKVTRKEVNHVQPLSFSVSSLEQAGNEVGCNTKFSVERSGDVFDKTYSDHLVKWTGNVLTVNNDYVEIEDNADISAKARIAFSTKGDGYYMVKGEQITMQATLKEKATCDKPFLAVEGNQVK
ncbi:hypothetical protein LMH73_007880 [Vibrio splendidus]|nr:hypothetical protein [Vibrio splendidus]MCC4883108.1 hypothetical protein [Vibrio splendidus]